MLDLIGNYFNKISQKKVVENCPLSQLQKGYFAAHQKGEISDDTLAYANRKIVELRKKIHEAGDVSLGQVHLLIKNRISQINEFTEDDFATRTSQLKEVYERTVAEIRKDIKSGELQKKLPNFNFETDSKSEKYQEIKKLYLAPLNSHLTHLNRLFCEPTLNKSAGIVIFNRKISRSQKVELEKRCLEKIKECEQMIGDALKDNLEMKEIQQK